MDRFTDLRFVIGLFFGLIGTILVVTGIWDQATDQALIADLFSARHINLVSGSVMALFGVGMMWLGLKAE